MSAAPDGPEAAETPVDGPAFPLLVRCGATLLVAALCVHGWQAADGFDAAALGSGGLGLLGAGLLVVVVGYGEILASRTVVGPESIRRRSLWSQEVRYEDITHVKLVRVPGLDWLVVPRLVVRIRGAGMTTFRAGDARLVAAFRRLAHGG